MIKQIQYTYKGMNQDVTKSKHPNDYYFEANNIRISTSESQTTASIVNEKGTTSVISLPSPEIDTSKKIITSGVYPNKVTLLTYTNDEINTQVTNGELPIQSGAQQIIGYSIARNSIVLLSTDSSGFDCIWEVEELLEGNFNLKLLYVRNLEFNINNPIQTLFNYENEIIEKVYWVDGNSQLRFLNLRHSLENGDLENLADINSNSINIVGEFIVSQPKVISISNGGTHTSGMIQYAYNLYRLNGAQTVISPLSEMQALDKGFNSGGGDINEVLGSSPTVEISEIDSQYTHIRVYAIKYTSYNHEPSVSLIADKEIDNYSNFTYFDDGSAINDISLSEFLFLGSNPFIPKHIQSKDNRLFVSHITEKPYIFEIDMRAYSFNDSNGARVYNSDGSNIILSPTNYNLPLTHDAINKNYDDYKYQSNGSIHGGEGKFIKYSITQKYENNLSGNVKYLKFFKDDEIYRLGIVFYNRTGQTCSPIWIADFKSPVGNLEGKYNTLRVELKLSAFNNYIDSLNLSDDEKPIGYRIVRADRGLVDRTILCQGVVSGMMVQTTRNLEVSRGNYWNGGSNLSLGNQHRQEESLAVVKMPLPVMRTFLNQPVIYGHEHLIMMNFVRNHTTKEYYRSDGGLGQENKGEHAKTEIFKEGQDSYKRQMSWQYTKMMQLYSPEILFNNGLTFGNNLEMKVKGLSKRTRTDAWSKQISTSSLSVSREAKDDNTDNIVLSNAYNGGSAVGNLNNWGFIAPCRNEGGDTGDDMLFHQLNGVYDKFIQNHSTNYIYKIYGSPEIVEKGQGTTTYNNDGQFKYVNSLESLITDKKKWQGRTSKNEPAISNVNSFGCRSLMIVEGDEDTIETSRKSIDEIHNRSGLSDKDGLLMLEVRRPDEYLYKGNIYGGNTYESKSKSSYIEIGLYNPITKSVVEIESPGDTFVQNFKFTRLSKTDTNVFSIRSAQVTDIVEFKVETTLNLQNRNDSSLGDWDNTFQPKYDDFHKYNRVYSQNSTLIQRQAELFKFKTVNNFDTRIISSKLKVPGEFIDNWTDFLENEIMDLDGKYGPINSLVNYNDNIYSLQDSAVAKIAINPRVQTQGNDGVNIELGFGGILHDYNYLSTTSGTINKWSVFTSNTGLYYYDAYNRALNFIQGNGISNVSLMKGMDSFFKTKIDYDSILKDNPLIGRGVVGFFDPIHNSAIITILQEGKSYTLGYNEKFQVFESFYDYHPSLYITKGFRILSTSPGLTNIHEHFTGNYNSFYGSKYSSDITLQLSPLDRDCVFNNISFKSQVLSNNIDIPKLTLTDIRCWNEYQDSSEKPLVVGKNINRKFRMWKANIPRQMVNNEPTLDRIRGQWAKLYLKFDNPSNYKLILHDILLNYTAYPN